MARSKSSSQGNKWRGFFNYNLREQDKSGIRMLSDAKTPPKMQGFLGELAGANYKTSFSQNSSSGGFLCTITGKEGSANAGWSLVVEHEDVFIAGLAAWFVVAEVYNWGEWPVEEERVPSW